MPTESEAFFTRIKSSHRRINPCFMTGKGCVSTEVIDREIELRRDRGCYSGFMIVPFRANISAFFDLCFTRYLRDNYVPPCLGAEKAGKLDIVRADSIWRTGYVICEKICRKIQDSDFVVADVSIPNANVFYELGLAFGANQKILVVYHKPSQFGQEVASVLARGGCRAYPYEDLRPLDFAQFPISQYIWQREATVGARLPSKPKILFYERLTQGNPPEVNTHNSQEDIRLDFKTHVMAAVGVAIDDVLRRIPKSTAASLLRNHETMIQEMKSAESVENNEAFDTILSRIQETYCMIVRTGANCHPMSYFWLGYCHALGKNVIPITVLAEVNEDIKDLAFDVRALWHMTFAWDNAEKFAPELEEILYQMIITDFAEWSRRGFWDQMLTRRGKVSIFSGALHNDEIGREMIGDWDLRSASELTSFFAMHQYRAVIESPVYQIEFVTKDPKASREGYLRGLERLLEDKNCVIIASPDVSPLTEFVLGRIYGIPRDYWFSDLEYRLRAGHSVVAVKQIAQPGVSDEETREN